MKATDATERGLASLIARAVAGASSIPGEAGIVRGGDVPVTVRA